MKSPTPLVLAASALLFSATVSPGEIKIVIDHNPNGEAGAGFKFKRVPPPAKNDAAAKAKFSIVEGERDGNGAELEALHDGKLPTEEDDPGENFFFNAGTEGGRLQVDLGSAIDVIDRDARPETVESAADAQFNTLTDAEKAAGWKLLFNGRDFSGWHNFKRAGVRPGWQVKEGALVCADPHSAGDIVTADKFRRFELQLDYNISHAGNSGIMYRVTDEGNAVWATGPEFQLEDNQAAADPVRCGWLYALYQPPDDPKTGKPLDATKPVGEWNHVRLLISPEKCEHEINGVNYFDYVLGS
ncbi:MAG: DUF1080 domain-containing protein, partial [Verrucomicrobiota bacterium]